MALVAYGSSDDSESEHEGEDTPTSNIPILSAPKKARETVKITIPSLQEFKEEDVDPQPSKKLKTKSGSGLFSILPPPKNTVSSTNFVPYVFSKKKESKVASSSVEKTKKEIDGLGKSSPGLSVDSDPEIPQKDNQKNSAPVVDYFSLDASCNKCDLPQIQTESVLFSTLPKPAQSTEFYEPSSSSHGLASSSNAYEEAETSSGHQGWDENCHSDVSQPLAPTAFLNDEGFKKIKGRRDKGAIDIIDINAGDQLTGKEQWLMQNLTEETVQKSSKKRHDMPTQQQKRKHQITYLAFQAKERELDLKNQWSLNSRTRRETQAKYGF